jgi:hypothetical protein
MRAASVRLAVSNSANSEANSCDSATAEASPASSENQRRRIGANNSGERFNNLRKYKQNY